MRRRIVAIRFDDGTERPVRDLWELQRYVRDLIQQESVRELIGPHARDADVDWLRRLIAIQQEVDASEQNRENASGPRKNVERDTIIESMLNFARDNGTLRGWYKTQAITQGMSVITLQKRMLAHGIPLPEWAKRTPPKKKIPK